MDITCVGLASARPSNNIIVGLKDTSYGDMQLIIYYYHSVHT